MGEGESKSITSHYFKNSKTAITLKYKYFNKLIFWTRIYFNELGLTALELWVVLKSQSKDNDEIVTG